MRWVQSARADSIHGTGASRLLLSCMRWVQSARADMVQGQGTDASRSRGRSLRCDHICSSAMCACCPMECVHVLLSMAGNHGKHRGVICGADVWMTSGRRHICWDRHGICNEPPLQSPTEILIVRGTMKSPILQQMTVGRRLLAKSTLLHSQRRTALLLIHTTQCSLIYVRLSWLQSPWTVCNAVSSGIPLIS